MEKENTSKGSLKNFFVHSRIDPYGSQAYQDARIQRERGPDKIHKSACKNNPGKIGINTIIEIIIVFIVAKSSTHNLRNQGAG